MTGSNNEDIEQEVYIRAWKNLDKYKEEGKFKSWINTIAANICRDYLGSCDYKKSNLCMVDVDEVAKVAGTIVGPEEKMLSEIRQSEILGAIEKLRPKYKEVIVLYEIKGLNYEQISKKIKCPVGTIKSRLYNARQELSISLKDLL